MLGFFLVPGDSHDSSFLRSLSLASPPHPKKHTLKHKFPGCEKEMLTPAESEHLRPMDVSKIQFKRVLEAEHVVAYIVREMDKMGAPGSLHNVWQCTP